MRTKIDLNQFLCPLIGPGKNKVTLDVLVNIPELLYSDAMLAGWGVFFSLMGAECQLTVEFSDYG